MPSGLRPVSGSASVDAPRRELSATFRLAWPLVLANLAQVAIGATDVLMVSWLGPGPLAAAALGANLFFLTFLLGQGLAMATAPLMAQALGRRVRAAREVRAIVGQGVLISVAYVLPCWAVMWHSGAILRAFGQDPSLSEIAEAYVQALQWGLLPAVLFVLARCLLAVLGRPRAAVAATVTAVVLNAFLNWVLIFGGLGAPALGVVGAAVSSSVVNLVMLLLAVGYCAYDRRLRRFRPSWRAFAPDLGHLAELLRVGVPISMALALEMSVFAVAAFLMGALGAEALVAHAIAMQVVSLTFSVPQGIAQAATVRVGLAAGRGAAVDVGRAGAAAYALGLGFMACTATLLVAAPGAVAEVFVDAGDPMNSEVVGLVTTCLQVAGLFQLFDGAQVIGAGALRGLRDTRVPMALAGIGYWAVGVPAAVALAFGARLGAVGVWVGLLLGLVAVACMVLVRWSRRETLDLVPGHAASCPNAAPVACLTP